MAYLAKPSANLETSHTLHVANCISDSFFIGKVGLPILHQLPGFIVPTAFFSWLRFGMCDDTILYRRQPRIKFSCVGEGLFFATKYVINQLIRVLKPHPLEFDMLSI